MRFTREVGKCGFPGSLRMHIIVSIVAANFTRDAPFRLPPRPQGKGPTPATYACMPCGHIVLCKQCAMRCATGGKCKQCKQFFVECQQATIGGYSDTDSDS